MYRRVAVLAAVAAPVGAQNCGSHACSTGYVSKAAPALICCNDAACAAVTCADSLCCDAVACSPAAPPNYAAANVAAVADLTACDTVPEPPCSTSCLAGYSSAAPPTVSCVSASAFSISVACTAVLCNANERVSAHVCTACQTGTVRPAGDDASGADTQCSDITCALPWAGHGSVGAAALADATPCSTVNAAAPCSLTCDASLGYQLNGTAPRLRCLEQPAGVGTWSVADPCIPIICAANQRVSSHACVACAAGYESSQGVAGGAGDATLADTSCTPMQCTNAAIDAASTSPHAQALQTVTVSTGDVIPTTGASPALGPKAGYKCSGTAVAMCPTAGGTTVTVSGYTCSAISCSGAPAGLAASNIATPADTTACDTVAEAACSLVCLSGYQPAAPAPLLDCVDSNADGVGEWNVTSTCVDIVCSTVFDPTPHRVDPIPNTTACDTVAKGGCPLQCQAGFTGSAVLQCTAADTWTVTPKCTALCSDSATATHVNSIPDNFTTGAGLRSLLPAPAPAETNCGGSGFMLKDNAHVTKCKAPVGVYPSPKDDCSLDTCCVISCGFATCPAGLVAKDASTANSIRCTGSTVSTCDPYTCCDPLPCQPARQPTVAGATVNCTTATAHGAVCDLTPASGYSCVGAVECTAASAAGGGYASNATCGFQCSTVEASATTCGFSACSNVAADFAGIVWLATGVTGGAAAAAADFTGSRAGGSSGAQLSGNPCAVGYAVNTAAVWACSSAGAAATLSTQLCLPASCDTLPLDSASCGGASCSGLAAAYRITLTAGVGGFVDKAPATAAALSAATNAPSGVVPCDTGLALHPQATFVCAAAGAAATVSRQLCTPAVCSSFDTSSGCGGAACTNTAAGYSSVVLTKPAAFSNGDAPTDATFSGAVTPQGVSTSGSVCGTGFSLSPAATFVCTDSAAPATVAAQLCVSVTSQCSSFDSAAGCGSGRCVGLAAGFADTVLTKSAAFVAAAPVAASTFAGAVNSAGAAVSGSPCATGYSLSTTERWACSSAGGRAGLAAQLCTAAPAATMCSTLSLAVGCGGSACAAVSAGWSGKVVLTAAGFTNGATVTATSFAGAVVSPSGAALQGTLCDQSAALNTAAVFNCQTAGGAATVGAQLCLSSQSPAAIAAAAAADGDDDDVSVTWWVWLVLILGVVCLLGLALCLIFTQSKQNKGGPPAEPVSKEGIEDTLLASPYAHPPPNDGHHAPPAKEVVDSPHHDVARQQPGRHAHFSAPRPDPEPHAVRRLDSDIECTVVSAGSHRAASPSPSHSQLQELSQRLDRLERHRLGEPQPQHYDPQYGLHPRQPLLPQPGNAVWAPVASPPHVPPPQFYPSRVASGSAGSFQGSSAYGQHRPYGHDPYGVRS
eukprot:TRINITY_DN14456_c0_g1_i1.p1 TRINITY_DN14456_c0_g1~~TRINITY_DN14456_c0_g1_i1.p1  ORF type:complete len:1369 (+),score=331.16 TRINITY_DN14456_c0_g1_i1:57-4163(+)